jgi:hypothetical protein
MRMKFNESSVKKLTPPHAGYALCWDEELCGFGLRVTVGRWPAVRCAAARKRAQAHLGQVAAGEDSVAERARGKLATLIEKVKER